MRGRGVSQSHDSESQSSFGHRGSEQEHAFDLRDPYKLNRAPLLRGGKRRLSTLNSYAVVMISAAALVGLGVYIGRELVRPPQRAWEGVHDLCLKPAHCQLFGAALYWGVLQSDSDVCNLHMLLSLQLHKSASHNNGMHALS